ncbi:hypothetical protein [Rickettsia endosymbiont of Cantharis rufa]|uniref:hypothetical protein n=1 Tax=Rickettsia endosymbiont of Cantharis rufa TaxID=3066248 RepID=UPI003133298E
MSKENLSNKSSINASKKGIKNATDSNERTPKTSINTPEGVTQPNLEPQKEQQSQNNKPAGKRTLKEDTALYSARVTRVGIAAGGVALEIVKGVSKIAVTHNPIEIAARFIYLNKTDAAIVFQKVNNRRY